MIELLGWALLTLAIAAILHVAAIWYIPRFFMRLVVRKSRKGGVPVNTFGYGGVHSAPVSKTLIPTINPDMAIALGVFDVSRGPVRVSCQTPPWAWDTYWSVSLYSSNTENILLVNDQAAVAEKFDLVIVFGDRRYQKQTNEQVVVSPSRTGVAIVRMLVKDRENKEELERIDRILRQTVMCAQGQYIA